MLNTSALVPECTFSLGHLARTAHASLWRCNLRQRRLWLRTHCEQVARQICGGVRLVRPAGCPDLMWEIARECWATKPADRPSTLVCVQLLSISVAAGASLLFRDCCCCAMIELTDVKDILSDVKLDFRLLGTI